MDWGAFLSVDVVRRVVDAGNGDAHEELDVEGRGREDSSAEEVEVSEVTWPKHHHPRDEGTREEPVGFKVASEGSDARDAVIHHFDEGRGFGFACVELAPERGHLIAPPRNWKVHHRMVAKILTLRSVVHIDVESIPVV